MHVAGCFVSTIALRYNCSRQAVYDLIKKYEGRLSVDDIPGRGRKASTTRDEDQEIIQRHVEDPFVNIHKTATQFDVSISTVRRRLKNAGLMCCRPYVGTLLTENHIARRLQWAVSHHCWYNLEWNQVLFSDESRFKLSFADGRLRIWRRRGERSSSKCI